MSFLIFAIFASRKYLDRNFLTIWLHVVIECLSRVFSHYLAQFLSEKGNNLSLIASLVVPLILNISQTSKKYFICAFRSLSCNPSNWTKYCTISIIFGLISKLLAKIVGLIMLDSVLVNDGLMYLDMVLYNSTMISG